MNRNDVPESTRIDLKMCAAHYSGSDFLSFLVGGSWALGWSDYENELFQTQIVGDFFGQIDAHLMAAIPHGLMMEYLPWLSPIFENPVQVEKGFALVPQKPGVGADIRAEAIERYGIT